MHTIIHCIRRAAILPVQTTALPDKQLSAASNFVAQESEEEVLRLNQSLSQSLRILQHG